MDQTTSPRDAIEHYLVERYGPFLTGHSLWKTIGFQSASAFRKAAARGALPVRTFRIEGRQGLFAYSAEVAKWISSVGGESLAPNEDSRSPPA
jgi:hypothetical protein